MKTRAYVVHLSWATARRDRLEPQLRRSGIDYEFVEGVDGRKIPDAELDAMIDTQEMARYPHWLTLGVLGATLGHRSAYEAICNAAGDVALVLENDAEVPPEFGPLLEDLAQHVKEREVLLLNYRSFEPIILHTSDGITVGDCQILRPAHPEHLMSACAYLLRRETAMAMRNAILPARWAPDSWNRYLERGIISGIRCVYPQPIREDITTRSMARHGSDVTPLERIQQSRLLPVQVLRILNRYRINRQMTRVRLVD